MIWDQIQSFVRDPIFIILAVSIAYSFFQIPRSKNAAALAFALAAVLVIRRIGFSTADEYVLAFTIFVGVYNLLPNDQKPQ
jgi:hypothetical protein